MIWGRGQTLAPPLSAHSVRIKWQDTTSGTCHPFFFFKYKKQKNKRTSQVWLKNDIIIWRHPLMSFFSFLFFSFLFFKITDTHFVKFVADRFSPSPTMHLTSRKQHLILQYTFFPTISKRSKAKNDSHPLKVKNIGDIQIFVPCCYPPQMEKGPTLTEYKNITIFIYQIASVGSCSGIHIYWESWEKKNLFDYHLQFQLSKRTCR